MLAPLCLLGALLMVSQGVVQNLKPYDTVQLLDPYQTSQLGSDGKPVIGPDGKPVMQTVTSADPSLRDLRPRRKLSRNWEPMVVVFSMRIARIRSRIPRRSQTFLQMFCILAIPSALTYTLGKMTGSPRGMGGPYGRRWRLLCPCGGVTTAYWSEARGAILC
jgi:potassium-transporting ATPase potassium-binding subunit